MPPSRGASGSRSAAASSAPSARPRKKPSREAAFTKRLAAEKAARAASLAAAGASAAGSSSSSGAAASRPRSSLAKGKGRAAAAVEELHPYRYKSFTDRLAAVHIDASRSARSHALAGLDGQGATAAAAATAPSSSLAAAAFDDDEMEDEDALAAIHARTSFGVALAAWRELNLSLPFTSFAQQAAPLAQTLPLLLHHLPRLSSLLAGLLTSPAPDAHLAYEAALDLIPRLALDASAEFLPVFPELLGATLHAATVGRGQCGGDEKAAASVVEKSFESVAATLKCVAPLVLRGQAADGLLQTWALVRPYLGGGAPEEPASGGDAGLLPDENVQSAGELALDEQEESELDVLDDDEVSRTVVPRPRVRRVAPHVRRFASEALAHLVRKAKVPQLQQLASQMFADLAEAETLDFARGIAGVWLEVAKSIDHRLQSNAVAQVSALLCAPAPSAAKRQARLQIGSLVLTALVHHSQAVHLTDLLDVVLGMVSAALDSYAESATAERAIALSDTTNWLRVLAGTRKGSRVADTKKPALFALLPRIATLAAELSQHASDGEELALLAQSLVTFIAVVLPIGRIHELVGTGLKTVEALSPASSAAAANSALNPAFAAVVIALGLSSVAWSGFSQFVMPAVIRSTTDVLSNAESTETEAALDLLAALHEQNQLVYTLHAAATPTLARWRASISRVVLAQLRDLADALATGAQLDTLRARASADASALRLVSLFPNEAASAAGQLRRIIDALVAVDSRATYDASAYNVASLLASTLNAFSDLIDAASNASTAAALLGDLLEHDGSLAESCLSYAWHRMALSAFARLYRSARAMSAPNASPPALSRLAPALQDAVMSSDSVLRSAAVELLSLAPAPTSSVLAPMPSRIAEIERIGLGVESVRDRNVRTRALARDLVRVAEADVDRESLPVIAELVIRFVVGTCKLNFRPLWDESRAALVELASRFGEDVWRVAFAELQHASPLASAPDTWMPSEAKEPEEGADALDGAADEQSTAARAEKHFVDPQLSARCAIVKSRLDASRRGAAGRQAVTLRTLAQLQTPDGRLDVLNYTAQILKAFGELTILVERHNAPLMEHFFAAIRDDRVQDEDDEDDGDEEETAQLARGAAAGGGLRLTLRERRARLCAYLELFSRFSNPKALLRAEELHSYLYTLCASGDAKVQKLALDCVLTWKDPAQVPYKARLHTLLDAPRFRDELTALNLSPDGDTIQPGHRARLMPLLLRLLFGLMISRRGRSSSAAGQGARKAAILAALSGCDAEDLRTLVDLMLAPFADQVPTSTDAFSFTQSACSASARRQSGFISLLADVIKHLGLVIVPLWPLLIGTTLNLARHADVAARASRGKATLGLRALRQAAIRRIAEFFRQPTDAFDWEPFLPALFSGLVSPRLSLLSSESVQSPSALLELFHTWAGQANTAPLLVRFDATLLPNVYACLAAPTAKPPVISCILELLERLLNIGSVAQSGEVDDAAALGVDIRSAVVRPHISPLLAGMTPLLRRHASAGGIDRARDELMRRQIRILAEVGPLVTEASDASALLALLGPMLRKSNHVIPERTKTDLLQIFCDLLLLTPEFQDPSSETFTRHYALFSGAFSMLRSRPARTTLGGLFRQFSKIDASLVRVAGWLEALNSFSTKRMEEPDFDRRLAAFDELNDERALPNPPLSPAEWLPIVHNMLFFIQDTEELAFRTNAGLSLRCFVVATESCGDVEQTAKMRELFHTVVYPGLRRCLRSSSELVRREVLSVLGTAVQHLGHCFETLGEMRGLLADGDEEANFFNNIHHIQVHRRARALRRLGDQADQGTLRSKAIAEIFAPLVTHFLQSGNVELHDHNLVNETIACLGRLARQMVWGAYNALLWRFLKLANEASAAQKVFVRAAMALLDAFHFEMDAQAAFDVRDDERDDEAADEEEKHLEQAKAAEKPAAEANESNEKEAARAAAKSTKILDAVTGRLLPALMGYLEQKDESDDAVRLPVAVGVVRVVQRLPTHVKETHIRKLLNTLAKVLKSKSQETRDLARDTLAKVATALGASYFPDMLRELRRALTRGPQLAVLAFTVHTLLVHLTTMAEAPLTLLDAGVDDVVHVATEDVFGHTSEDRVGMESRTKMREMRQSKSLDTFEQLARVAAPARMSALLLPLRDIMQQTEAHKAIVSVEDVLRRIASGINANVHLDAATFLVLCHSLISRNAVFLQPRASTTEGRKGKSLLGYRFAVHMKRADVEAGLSAQDHYARNAHRFVVFGLDLLIVAMRRARFDFHSADTLARLDPLVSVVGNTLYASDASVVNAGLKGVSALVKCPLPALETALPVYIKQILAAIHREGSAHSDIAQTALKALTSILREAKSVHFKDRQLGDLLSLVVDDIEEPGAQSAIFALLRAVIARRFVVPEVYDIMDRVAEMLVTNQSAQVRDTCRATFLQFLLDFPQGKQRLRNQVRFLAKNVSYDFESGRLSVMELLSAVLTKFDDGVLREHADVLFVSLVMALANDDSAACRAQAASLIKVLISVIDDEHRARLAQLTHSWAEQSERRELARVAMQVYSLMLEASPETASTWAPRALAAASSCLADAASALEELESDQFFDPMDVDSGLDWQLPYQALQAVEKLHAHDAALVDSRGAAGTWSSVRELLLFPHAWVRLGASRLLGLLFSPVDPSRPASGVAAAESPFSLESLIDIARKLTLQLRAPRIDESASTQAVKNLLYIGRCFALCPAPSQARALAAQEDANDESDAEDEDDDGGDVARGVQENPLAWLFTKLSYTARAAQLARADMQPQTEQAAAVLRWFAAMAMHLEPERTADFMPHILGPLFRILDDESLKGAKLEELKTLATEVQDVIQARVGTTRYASAYTAVRQRALEKRRERKTAKLMQGIADPEKAAKRKARDNLKKHDARKRKSNAYAETKQRTRPLKHH